MEGTGRRLIYALCAGLVSTVAGGLPAAASGPQQHPAAQPAAPYCDSQFHQVTGGDEAPVGGMNSMAAVSPDDVWAVGANQGPQGNGATAERWDGSNWAEVTPYLSVGPFSVYRAVAPVPGSLTGNVWVTGRNENGEFAALWGGSSWTVFKLPQLSTGDRIAGVVAISATNVWAVGSSAGRTMIDHYDGAAWSVVPSADPSPTSTDHLSGVAAVSASDIWAVGSQSDSGLSQSLIEHWDGNTWSIVATPDVGGSNSLDAVAAPSSSSVWAVGNRALAGGLTEVLIERWNGTSWSSVASPNVGYAGSNKALHSVTALSPDNVWASGGSGGNSLVEHWSRGAWSVVPSQGNSNESNAIVAPSPSDVWTGGTVAQEPVTGLFRAVFENLCIPAPTVTSVVPANGNSTGGSTVTITGTAFASATGVSFGSMPAAEFKVLSESSISALAPPAEATGVADVTVTNYGGTSALVPRDIYVFVPPAISWRQYTLSGSDGTAWQPVDASALSLDLSPTVDSNAVLSGNADLWTSLAGVNQDLGISISGGAYGPGTLVGWKEGGGNSGTFSPTAAFVQVIIPVKAATPYTVTLEWKANHPTGGTIYLGAGLDPGFSPSRLTAELVPAIDGNLRTVTSTRQYGLSGSDGSTWQDMDGSALVINNFSPSVTGTALLTTNSDLWTKTPGLNQDLGISVSGGSFGAGQIVGWKEGGGGAGTFSPTTAFVQATAVLVAGTPYSIRLVWKTNFPTGGSIWAGAGPTGPFSPTRLTIHLFPIGTGLQDIASTQQYSKTGGTGSDWSPVDGQRLVLNVQPTADSLYILSANADLWTANLGVNQDIAIFVSGGRYTSETMAVWKESGGRGGTFSPHAAYVQTVIPLAGGTRYTIMLEWKANHATSGTLYAGAGVGPAPNFSPTRLTAQPIN